MYMTGPRKQWAGRRVRIRTLWTASGDVNTHTITRERPDRPIRGLRES
jgi:hypothetical protein